MTNTVYIHHVTLQTGHVARQYRREVSDEAIVSITKMLDAVFADGKSAVPGFPGFWVSGVPDGRSLTITLWTGAGDNRLPILTSTTCLKSRSSIGAWRALHDSATLPYATDPSDPPPAPWTADRLEIGYNVLAGNAIARGEASFWTGNFARCVAWAWAEYKK